VFGGSKPGLDIVHQLTMQILGSAITVVYCGVITFILLKVIDLTVGLRVTAEQETTGLDLAEHGEVGYNL